MEFYDEKGLAVCGLACVLCREEDCPGCKAMGCSGGCDCDVYACAASKGLDGCYQCGDFPCERDMLKGTRIRAFNMYARKYGKADLLERLKANFENGITYHRADGLTGDYDKPEAQEDILRLLRFGTVNPYTKCPKLETEHFVLRLVKLSDAEDLMRCYQDPKAQRLFNSVCCSSDFCFSTLDELRDYIKSWLEAYDRQEFIRYAIVDKNTSRAVGTVEMFGMIGEYKTDTGILRLDIMSEFETEPYLLELFSLCVNEFFLMFGTDNIVTLAVAEAKARIKALNEAGFSVCESQTPQYNYICGKKSIYQ